MIHEIGDNRYSPEYKNISASDSDRAMSIVGAKILTKASNGQVMMPGFLDFKKLFPDSYNELKKEAYYLFSIDEQPFFSVELSETEIASIREYEDVEEAKKDIEKTVDQGEIYFYMVIHKLRELRPVEMVFAAATGLHIMSWKRSRLFCGVCGTKAVHSNVERAMICPKCHAMEFPKISPAVIVAIKNKDDKLLLVKNKLGNYHKLALVSGFVEVGESFEDTVKREVMEEVGIKVKNIRFYKSQPWGLSMCEMIGYLAEVDGDDTITLQESELSEGAWYSREEAPNHAYGLSIGNEIIHRFKIGEL